MAKKKPRLEGDRFVGVPDEWVRVDTNVGPQSRRALQTIQDTLSSMMPEFKFKIFDVGYWKSKKMNLKLFKTWKD